MLVLGFQSSILLFLPRTATKSPRVLRHEVCVKDKEEPSTHSASVGREGGAVTITRSEHWNAVCSTPRLHCLQLGGLSMCWDSQTTAKLLRSISYPQHVRLCTSRPSIHVYMEGMRNVVLFSICTATCLHRDFNVPRLF